MDKQDFDCDERIPDCLISLGHAIETQEKNKTVEVPERVEQVFHTYELMKRIIEDKDATITYGVHKPFNSMGYVNVKSPCFVEIHNMELFMEAIKPVDNIEICAMADDAVEIDFGFHGLSTAKK